MTLDYRGIILRRMQELGWTQAELAFRSGISEATISQALRGRTVPNFETVEDLINTVGYDLTVKDGSIWKH